MWIVYNWRFRPPLKQQRGLGPQKHFTVYTFDFTPSVDSACDRGPKFRTPKGTPKFGTFLMAHPALILSTSMGVSTQAMNKHLLCSCLREAQTSTWWGKPCTRSAVYGQGKPLRPGSQGGIVGEKNLHILLFKSIHLEKECLQKGIQSAGRQAQTRQQMNSIAYLSSLQRNGLETSR